MTNQLHFSNLIYLLNVVQYIIDTCNSFIYLREGKACRQNTYRITDVANALNWQTLLITNNRQIFDLFCGIYAKENTKIIHLLLKVYIPSRTLGQGVCTVLWCHHAISLFPKAFHSMLLTGGNIFPFQGYYSVEI